jgi:hypothetical protein
MARQSLTREDAREILQVSEGATADELDIALRALIHQHHLDKPGRNIRLAQRIYDACNMLLAELPPPPPIGPAEGGVTPARPPAGPSERVEARSDDPEDEEEEEDAEDAEDDASISETEAEAHPPAGTGAPEPKSKRKRKRRSGGSQAARAAALNRPFRTAGYIDRGRRTFRDNQGALVTGTKRSCMPDALWMGLKEAGYEVELEDVRSSIMPEDPDADSTFGAAIRYAAELGFELVCVSKEMQKQKGGYAYNLLLRKTGMFLVQLRLTSGKDDPLPPDLHVALYDGKCVRDNQWYTKVKMIEDSDRNVQGARLVFDSLCKDLEVRINNIYELKRA